MDSDVSAFEWHRMQSTVNLSRKVPRTLDQSLPFAVAPIASQRPERLGMRVLGSSWIF